MTEQDIKNRLAAIADTAHDFEAAHSMEKQLHIDFIEWLSEQTKAKSIRPSVPKIAQLAALVLTSRDIAFARRSA